MRIFIPPFSALFLFALAFAAPAPLPFFAMDNGVGRGSWSPAKQAGTLRELAYQGISYNYTNPADLRAWLAELRRADLRLFAIYFPVKLDTPDPFPPGLAESVALLRDTGAVLWVIVPKPAATPATATPAAVADLEATALARIRQAADLAATAGLRVSLYPHKGFHLTTAEQALDLVLKSSRANLGLTVNLAHELAAGHGPRLPEILRRVAPCITMVTLNGATDRPGPAWDNYIQPLGRGDYDVAALVRTLREVHYTGPVGLQLYNVKGDPRENLATSIVAWRSLSSAHSNVQR